MVEFSQHPPFALGTFSFAGCAPFAGAVFQDKIIALNAVRPLAVSKGLPFGRADTMQDMLDSWVTNFDTLLTIFGEAGEMQGLGLPTADIAVATIHAPVPSPRQIFCAGANYRKHVVDLVVDHGGGPETQNMSADERRVYANKQLDERASNGTPYAFVKLASAVTGPFDAIALPTNAIQSDWELELGVVMGRAARNISAKDALQYIAGYTVTNDLTCRDRVYRNDMKILGTDWLQGKCSPGFLPVGPYLVPSRFIGDPQKLHLQLKLNGQVMQDESTSDMIFSVARIIEYLSHYIQLWPGDLICTGSPSGNGTHYGRYLRDGDVLEGSISGLGTQRNICVAPD